MMSQTIPLGRERGDKAFFSRGDVAHVHTVDGLVRGKVVAVNQYVLLMSDGREYPRRDCHLGRSC